MSLAVAPPRRRPRPPPAARPGPPPPRRVLIGVALAAVSHLGLVHSARFLAFARGGDDAAGQPLRIEATLRALRRRGRASSPSAAACCPTDVDASRLADATGSTSVPLSLFGGTTAELAMLSPRWSRRARRRWWSWPRSGRCSTTSTGRRCACTTRGSPRHSSAGGSCWPAARLTPRTCWARSISSSGTGPPAQADWRRTGPLRRGRDGRAGPMPAALPPAALRIGGDGGRLLVHRSERARPRADGAAHEGGGGHVRHRAARPRIRRGIATRPSGAHLDGCLAGIAQRHGARLVSSVPGPEDFPSSDFENEQHMNAGGRRRFTDRLGLLLQHALARRSGDAVQ